MKKSTITTYMLSTAEVVSRGYATLDETPFFFNCNFATIFCASISLKKGLKFCFVFRNY